jgi:hypothetical protein
MDGSPDDLDWHPMGVPMSFNEAASLIQEYDFTEHRSAAASAYGGIVGVAFEYRKRVS